MMAVRVETYEDRRTGKRVIALSSTEHVSRRKKRYSFDEWRTFTARVKAGEFDCLVAGP
jgi:hypothetical protein